MLYFKGIGGFFIFHGVKLRFNSHSDKKVFIQIKKTSVKVIGKE
jgi:hypothetical protein